MRRGPLTSVEEIFYFFPWRLVFSFFFFSFVVLARTELREEEGGRGREREGAMTLDPSFFFSSPLVVSAGS
jgi:hypothetical protein